MTEPPESRQRQLVKRAIIRLRARIMATVFAMVGGTGLLLATIWLLLRGGENVGSHLGLLQNYFPGYEVTWTGSLVGFAYGALVGGALGWLIARIYNQFADPSRSS